ncbi:MAG: phosphoribosylaminoimidazolesuccinocarboxamide synthase [bacterium]|nr:phosphoribosylaminoimidazolesuccinocarboxamide synthase [bacterium]
MGSVKDLQIIKNLTENSSGLARFIFSDRYSVFDWGEMPDHIYNKGCAIAILGGYFFEKLEERGILTQYIGLVEDGEVKKLSYIKNPVNTMEITLLNVIKPQVKETKYDYSEYQGKKGGFLIPLEIIYRNFLPEGSSVFKRFKKGDLMPEDLGLADLPTPGQKLDKPFIDVSTKLEITDRYLSWNEAKHISGLNDKEISNLKKLAININTFITNEFSKIGLINEDGKMEFGFDAKRNLMVIDVLGTLDECRLTYNGLPVSKEIARIYYRHTRWYQAVEEAKKADRHRWKEICKLSPQSLPEKLKKAISQIYCSCTNEITQKKWFKDIPPLKEVLKEVKEVLKL